VVCQHKVIGPLRGAACIAYDRLLFFGLSNASDVDGVVLP